MAKVFVALFFAHNLCIASAAGSSPIDGKCKQANDYVKGECGVKDKSLTCCSHKQVCLGPIVQWNPEKKKDKSYDDKYACSETRKLSGAKVMKVVLIPMLFMIMDILFIVFLAVPKFGFDIKKNHVTKLCIGVIAVSWPLLLSSKAHFGIYSSFLAMLVAYVSTVTDFPRWVYRVIWLMQVFQVILLFGPNEAFHVPIYKQSLGAKTDLVTTIMKLTEADCDKHYDSFFKYDAIEKFGINVNIDAEYYGFCTEEFIGFVQITCLVQGMLWIVTSLVNAPILLPDETAVSPEK